MATTLQIEFLPASINTVDKFIIYASGPVSQGTTVAPGYRFMLSHDPQFSFQTSPISFLTQWKAIFGDPIVGQKIYVKLIRQGSKGIRTRPLFATAVVG